ncbi:MAG: inositol monophosphatase family protein [Pseudomonadota bacterium]
MPERTADVPTVELVLHAERIAALAAEAALSYFRQDLGIDFKADSSPVTQADRGVEAIVRTYLAAHFPDDGVWGEEAGFQGAEKDHIWIIDPIDGTRSFLSGHPLFGFLLARLNKGEPELGVISVPALGETLIGTRDRGARLNGTPLSVSRQVALERAVLFVNEGDRIFRDHPDLFGQLMQTGQTRRFSYDCYPHALLAMGHVDAVIDCGLQPYDYLPVAAVVHAAGGVMTDWRGAPLSLHSDGRVVSAATPELHAALLQLVRAH